MKDSLIILSKNRAIQLHLLLDSIDLSDWHSVCVMYKASNDLYELGYRQSQKFFPTVKFIQDTADSCISTLITMLTGYARIIDDDSFFHDNKFVGCPHNRVRDNDGTLLSAIQAGSYKFMFYDSAEYLNKMYLNGYKISVNQVIKDYKKHLAVTPIRGADHIAFTFVSIPHDH